MQELGVKLDNLDTVVPGVNKPGGLKRYEGLDKKDPYYVKSHRFFARELAAKPKAEALMLLNLASKRLFEISMRSDIRTSANQLVENTDALLMDKEGYPRQVIRAQDRKLTELTQEFFKLATKALEKNDFVNNSKEAQARLLFDLAAALGLENLKPGIEGNEKIADLVNKKANELSKDSSFNDALLGQLIKLATHDFGVNVKAETKAPEAPGPDIHPGLEQDPVDNLNSTFVDLYGAIEKIKAHANGSEEVELKRFYSLSLIPAKKDFLEETVHKESNKIETAKRNLINALELFHMKLKETSPELSAQIKNDILNPLNFNIDLIASRDDNRAKRFLAANLIERYNDSLKQIKLKDPTVQEITDSFKRKLSTESDSLYKQEESPSEAQKIRITKLIRKIENFLRETIKYSGFLDRFTKSQAS